MDGQPAWRFCDKCFGMFFNGDPNPNRKGRCPAGDAHHAQGFVYYLPHDVPATVGQPDWRFCDKCFGMFFNGDPDPNRKGRCPAGDTHHAQGFLFVLPHDVPATVGQPGWRFCDKCFGMFFNGDPDPNRKGRCPAGDRHHAQGFLFVLPHRLFPSPSITIRVKKETLTTSRSMEVIGFGFEPNQTSEIIAQINEGTSSAFFPPPVRITIDNEGRFDDGFSLSVIQDKSVELSSAKVRVFDFGSGETAIAIIK